MNRFEWLVIALMAVAAMIVVATNGCNRHQPKAWLSVEKAPVRIIYVDYYQDINASTAMDILRVVKQIPYQATTFNQSTTVGIQSDYDMNYNDTVNRQYTLQKGTK